jgi:hypothetical protein
MQDRAGAAFEHDAQMQWTFVGRLSPMIIKNLAAFINQQNVLGSSNSYQRRWR